MRGRQTMNVGEAFAKAMAAYEAGRSVDARRLAKQILDVRPDFGGAHYLSGLLSIDQGMGKRAAEHLAKAISISPGQSVLHIAMARALELAGEINGALLHYRMVLSIDAMHAEAHARLGELLGRAGKLDEAVAHCRRAVNADPAHAEAWNTLGALLQRQGKPDQAAEALRQALALRPDWAAALNNFGVALKDLGKLSEAATILEGAIELRPSAAGYRANLASVLRLSGRFEAARRQAERATKLDSRNPDGWVELGLARQAQGHLEGAATAFDRAVTVGPDKVHALYCLAEIRRMLGQSERAQPLYRRCLDIDPADRHGAALGLALSGGAPAPAKAPEAYVRQLFDDYADTFDAALVDKLDYRAPALLSDAMKRALGPLKDLVVMDAGCGTGLAAPVLRGLAARLDGVDLSPAMVAKARERVLYDHVVEGELVAVLRDRPARYDLIVAADVLVYLGDLEPVMNAARAALKEKGAFAFTVERSDEVETYVLGAKSRYAHAVQYVRRAAESAGFTVALLEKAVTRRDSGTDVPGLVAVLTTK